MWLNYFICIATLMISWLALSKGVTLATNIPWNITAETVLATETIKSFREQMRCDCLTVPGWAIALLVIISLLIILAIVIIAMLVITWSKLQRKALVSSGNVVGHGNNSLGYRSSMKPNEAHRNRNTLPPLNYGEERRTAVKNSKKIEEELRDY